MASLDAEELLHLGLHASQHDDPARAIDYLKQCLALQPDNADATYLLGALYAQIGIYDRAKNTLIRAVDLNGAHDLNGAQSTGARSAAVFQLGLLHLTSGAVTEAAEAWSRLDALPEDHCFNLFRRALLALAKDEFSECLSLLEQGIAANTVNDALNDDMRRLRASAEVAMQRSMQVNAVDESTPAGKGHHLLGSYRQKNRH